MSLQRQHEAGRAGGHQDVNGPGHAAGVGRPLLQQRWGYVLEEAQRTPAATR
jgi:hypothetical protein